MEILLTATKAVLPLVILISTGYACKLTGILTDEIIKSVNKLVFHIMMPILIFNSIYTSNFMDSLDAELLISITVITVIVFVIALAIVPRFEKDNPRRGSLVQGIFRGNDIIIGLPVLKTLSGNTLLGPMAMAVSVLVVVYNTLVLINFEVFRKGRPNLPHVLLGIIKNPLIISSVGTIILVVFGIKIPAMVTDITGDVGTTASTLAIILVGASLDFSAIRHYVKYVAITTFIKLILVPALTMVACILLGMPAGTLTVIFCIIASPTAVNSFTMAQEMGGDGKLAAAIVAATSLCSILTIFIGVIIFQNHLVLA